LTPPIVKRVHELYEELGREDVRSVQAWDKAEQENRNDEAKAEPNPEVEAAPKAKAKTETKPETKAKPKTKAKK
jgi:hypothetical protein